MLGAAVRVGGGGDTDDVTLRGGVIVGVKEGCDVRVGDMVGYWELDSDQLGNSVRDDVLLGDALTVVVAVAVTEQVPLAVGVGDG